MQKTYTDHELQTLWQQGQEWAFEAIYKRYVIKLIAIAMQKTGDRAISEEIVQDTFLMLFNKKQNFQHTSLFAYLYVIMKNKLLDKFRHDQVRRKYEQQSAITYQEADDSMPALIETRDLERIIDAEIEKLSPQCKTVFTLSRKQLLSNKEIANALSISENTVEQHMRKAIRTLRLSISKDIGVIFFLF